MPFIYDTSDENDTFQAFDQINLCSLSHISMERKRREKKLFLSIFF